MSMIRDEERQSDIREIILKESKYKLDFSMEVFLSTQYTIQNSIGLIVFIQVLRSC